MSAPPFEVADIVRAAGKNFIEKNRSRLTWQHVRVLRAIELYLELADEFLRRLPQNGFDAYGNPLQCRASTRKGTPCQRMPLPHNGYCPSHQHLADTEDRELAAA